MAKINWKKSWKIRPKYILTFMNIIETNIRERKEKKKKQNHIINLLISNMKEEEKKF